MQLKMIDKKVLSKESFQNSIDIDYDNILNHTLSKKEL